MSLLPVIKGTKWICLTRDQFALVDDEDYEHLIKFSWYAIRGWNNHTFYAAYKTCDGKTIAMHRVLLGLTSCIKLSHIPLSQFSDNKDYRADHINQNGLDNRKSNLRIVTISQNAVNSKIRKDNTSGFKGVSWRQDRNKYRAYIATLNSNKKTQQVTLGHYETPEEAAKAYDKAAKKYFGEFAMLNFPNKD